MDHRITQSVVDYVYKASVLRYIGHEFCSVFGLSLEANTAKLNLNLETTFLLFPFWQLV